MHSTAQSSDKLSHGKLKSILTGINLAAGASVLGLGLMVIFGWYVGSSTLVQVHPAFVPMQYNTALGFVLCGGSLLLLFFDREKWAIAAGGLTALIGGLTLLQYVAGVSLGIDELLMEHDITVATSHAGRMAPNTALCFALIGLAVVLPSIPLNVFRGSLPRVIPASLAFGLGAVALSGYYTRMPTAYQWGDLTRMAVHSSLGFIVVSTGLLCWAWNRDIREERLLPRWMPIPTAIAILTSTLSFWQALLAERQRLRLEFPDLGDLTTLTNLANLMLFVGILLSVAMAMMVFFIQKTEQRTREVVRALRKLKKEIAIRQTTEIALEVHRDHLEELVDARTIELDMARQDVEAENEDLKQRLKRGFRDFTTEMLGELAGGGESEQVEFKSTLRWNLHTGKPDKRIENACLKTVAAYLNSDGGVLLVGIDDEGRAVGLEPDQFANEDKLLLHWNGLIAKSIGPEVMPMVRNTVLDFS
ncbi:MAG: putative DNA binding domain-containing protein, partial [Planctomycetota bacterium]|nr:putative DNA binding domain-containing protein [Planctomycetota bacterium]